LNSAFDEFLDEKHAKRDFYPESARQEIDETNPWVYDFYNNGVYKVSYQGSSVTVVWLRFSSICLYVEEV
jgi:glutathionyl-hydroquinone reductase